jgi:hypothetical protein
MLTLALVPTQFPIELLLGLCMEVKWLGCEVNHLLPSNAEIKNVWSYTSLSLVRLCGVDSQNIYLLPYSSLRERVCDTAHCRIMCCHYHLPHPVTVPLCWWAVRSVDYINMIGKLTVRNSQWFSNKIMNMYCRKPWARIAQSV